MDWRKRLQVAHEIAFWVLAALTLVAAILTLLIFSGRLVSDEPQSPAAPQGEATALNAVEGLV
jgi:hypothetical protein